MPERKAVVVHSGGMDSTTLLMETIRGGMYAEVFSFGVNYGQKHARRELDCAARICADLQIGRVVADLRAAASCFMGSALTGLGAVPEGHYKHESMKATVVNNRNMVILSLAAAFAQSVGAMAVYYGAHAGDHAIYPDCRKEFYSSCAVTIGYATDDAVRLFAPYGAWNKERIVRRGELLRVPWSITWSCYNGRERHCGKCGTCVERREAFQLAGVVDPTEYEGQNGEK